MLQLLVEPPPWASQSHGCMSFAAARLMCQSRVLVEWRDRYLHKTPACAGLNPSIQRLPAGVSSREHGKPIWKPGEGRD